MEQAGRGCVQRRSWPCAVKNAHLRKRRKKKNVPFFDEGRDALRAVLWAVGPAPRARAFKRKNSRKRKFMESYQGRQPSYMRRLSEKREKRKHKLKRKSWLAFFVDTIKSCRGWRKRRGFRFGSKSSCVSCSCPCPCFHLSSPLFSCALTSATSSTALGAGAHWRVLCAR